MKRILLSGLVSGIVLLVFSYLCLMLSIRLAPQLVEEFYNPIFYPGHDRALLFFLHPFVLSFALAWFWNRAKTRYEGSLWARGFHLGWVYCLIATIPAMWITFSAINVPLLMVMTWIAYGFCQAVVAGWILAWMNP
jgi:hypothetical protein